MGFAIAIETSTFLATQTASKRTICIAIDQLPDTH